MSPEQAEIRAEYEEQIKKALLKVCPADELDIFFEWMEEETNYRLYWNDEWINTTTQRFHQLDAIYEEFKELS